ncbi:hypothetical protein TL16_g12355 [Triparma laevis f. inornata]|uniref:Ubiquitin conjugation factor E4 core domain-containing protein n=1 Tax=Triparma laevis f. inornata TaxID=1714386 RepID=A0A9W7ETS8_9STRA|nr:hypothetical protein TL16_g12355 [Triparma laevis f. inornata]
MLKLVFPVAPKSTPPHTMSGFGDSLRAWANIGGDPDPPQEEPSIPTPQTPSDPDEIRRKRLARMAGSNSSNSPRQSSAPTQMETTPVSNPGPRGRLDFTSPDLDMEVADDNDNDNVNDNDEDLVNEGGQTQTQKQLMSQTLDPAALRASTAPPFTSDRPPALLSDHPSPRKTKRLRKRDATMIKVLSITTVQSDQTDLLTYIKFGEGESQPAIIPVDSLDSLIAGRLNLQSSALKRDKSAIAYLTNLHERARMELSKVSEEKEDDLTTKTMLMDAKKCAATYAVSCLLYEELFASSHHSKDELVKCLLSNTAQICNHAEGSFLSDVVKELINQEELENVVGPVVDKLMENFGGGSLLEEKAAKSSNSSRALQSLLNIKAVAVATSSFPNFNLPSSSSPVAKEVVQPSMDGFDTQQQQFMAMMLRMQNNRSVPGAYLRRSGPALETSTILGRLLSLGLPTRDPKVTSQFANAARRTMQDVNNVKEGLRKTNMVHLELSTQIVKALLKGGKESRNGALAWFKDSLIVNCRAGGDVNYRDASKNSSTHTMLNIATVLLKLSGPFVGSEEKRKLIDPSFVWSEEAHGGVYASSGDEKVDRLNCDTPTPKNVDPNQPAKDFNFITNCFFLTARALNLGLFPLTSTYHSLGRQLGHMNWQIRSRGGDAASDPNFNRALSMHMAHEVVAADPELIREAVKFYDVLAEMMCSLDTDTVQAMPEFFVDDVCSILNFAATERGVPSDVLKGVSVANIFNLVIRLLSPAHAKTIKNYNLRARLGDILFHIFLPSECKREEDEPQYGEDVPASVCCDPKTGQPFLLSSKEAQDTLAPSLLLLYGEVEHTGPYEKQGFRSRICSLLKYLWNSPQHHNA